MINSKFKISRIILSLLVGAAIWTNRQIIRNQGKHVLACLNIRCIHPSIENHQHPLPQIQKNTNTNTNTNANTNTNTNTNTTKMMFMYRIRGSTRLRRIHQQKITNTLYHKYKYKHKYNYKYKCKITFFHGISINSEFARHD